MLAYKMSPLLQLSQATADLPLHQVDVPRTGLIIISQRKAACLSMGTAATLRLVEEVSRLLFVSEYEKDLLMCLFLPQNSEWT
jgi:hypothetical protein